MMPDIPQTELDQIKATAPVAALYKHFAVRRTSSAALQNRARRNAAKQNPETSLWLRRGKMNAVDPQAWLVVLWRYCRKLE
jgi:hypothetical protein